MTNKARKPDHLCKGQRWFVKIDGSTALLSAEVIDITECTVALMEPGNFDLAARYKLDDVEFVEQIVERTVVPPLQNTALVEQVRSIR